MPNSAQAEQWGSFEVELKGSASGNPFDVEVSAEFSHGDERLVVGGFFDGDGTYRIRFMPPSQGTWQFVTSSSCKELSGRTGKFESTAPTPGNHGPVQVHNTYHFRYADGTPYRQIGTTCYAWIHQPEQLQDQTLATLKASPFNKLRMCVFPKNYAFNNVEPPLYPYEGTAPAKWDFTRFNPRFFQHFEKRLVQLRDLGIEA